ADAIAFNRFLLLGGSLGRLLGSFLFLHVVVNGATDVALAGRVARGQGRRHKRRCRLHLLESFEQLLVLFFQPFDAGLEVRVGGLLGAAGRRKGQRQAGGDQQRPWNVEWRFHRGFLSKGGSAASRLLAGTARTRRQARSSTDCAGGSDRSVGNNV